MSAPANGPASRRPMIETQGLVKAYGLLPVLRQLNLEIPRGQAVALLGPNGSGKSTLLRLLAGLSRPTAGRILVGGWELPQESLAVRAQIGLVAHKPLLYDTLTAHENLRFFGQLYHLPDDTLDARIAALLDQVGLSKRAHDLARTFSRGMQQRLSIARALLHNPHVLLFDEPHTGLDQEAAATLDDLLNAARAAGHTLVMATHQFDRVPHLADRVIIIARGRLVYDAPCAGLTAAYLTDEYTRVTGAVSAR